MSKILYEYNIVIIIICKKIFYELFSKIIYLFNFFF